MIQLTQLEYQCGYGKMHRFCARFRAVWHRGGSALPSACPATSLVFPETRTTAGVVQFSQLLEGTAVLVRVLGHTLFPLWFPNVFQAVCCIGAARVHGADRRTRTCAASRGPLPSGRGAPWNAPPPRAPGMARSARIRPRNLHFPLFFKGFYHYLR